MSSILTPAAGEVWLRPCELRPSRGSGTAKLLSQFRDTVCDVVADHAHTFDAPDAALGGLVGVPVLEAGARHLVDFCLPAKNDDEVDAAQHVVSEDFRGRT